MIRRKKKRFLPCLIIGMGLLVLLTGIGCFGEPPLNLILRTVLATIAGCAILIGAVKLWD